MGVDEGVDATHVQMNGGQGRMGLEEPGQPWHSLVFSAFDLVENLAASRQVVGVVVHTNKSGHQLQD